MITFPVLIKEIRKEAGLNQLDFAKKLGVSAALIAMIETGQKDVSKKFIVRLAEVLRVHPTSITPFLFYAEAYKNDLSKLEMQFFDFGNKMQIELIKKRAKYLKNEA